jgi:hypothetical protein
MSFNVGDVVSNCGGLYVVLDVNEVGEYQVRNIRSGYIPNFYCSEELFTLVTPAGPPPSKLTGMTQFFKDQKEKTNVT